MRVNCHVYVLYPLGLLIRRRTMEISFRGRRARARCNNNLLTSHVIRRVILHPPTRLATFLSPSLFLSFSFIPCPLSLACSYGSRSCQPQLSFIVLRIYGSVYSTNRWRYRIVPKLSGDSSARDRSYILVSDSTVSRTLHRSDILPFAVSSIICAFRTTGRCSVSPRTLAV